MSAAVCRPTGLFYIFDSHGLAELTGGPWVEHLRDDCDQDYTDAGGALDAPQFIARGGTIGHEFSSLGDVVVIGGVRRPGEFA